jgi:hypothetical protein
MSTRALRSTAAAGAAGALISIVTSLAVPAGLMSDDSSPAWNTIDLVTDVLLAAGLAGFIAFGDSTALHYFIACTWTAWLILFAALWS